MPRSGLVDIVAPAHELPLQIVAHMGRPPPAEDEQLASEHDSGTRSTALQKICTLLRTQTGHDFSLYKKSTIYRRIELRQTRHGQTHRSLLACQRRTCRDVHQR